MNKRLLAALGVFVVIIAISLGISRYHQGRYAHWVQVPGSVIAVTPHPRSARHDISYLYSDGDHLREGSESYSGRTSDTYHVGQGIEVWMNPDTPSQSSLHQPDAGLAPYAPFFLGVPILLCVLFGRPRRNPHRHSPYFR